MRRGGRTGPTPRAGRRGRGRSRLTLQQREGEETLAVREEAARAETGPRQLRGELRARVLVGELGADLAAPLQMKHEPGLPDLHAHRPERAEVHLDPGLFLVVEGHVL